MQRLIWWKTTDRRSGVYAQSAEQKSSELASLSKLEALSSFLCSQEILYEGA